jgi:hypothetical protein
MDAIEHSEGAIEPLHAELRRLYHTPVDDNLSLIEKLESSGLLIRKPRWLFAHDSFEEYFAAGYLVSFFEDHESWPPLKKWRDNGVLRPDFVDILGFVRDALSPKVASAIRVSAARLFMVLVQKGRYGPEFDGLIFNVDCDLINSGPQPENVHLLEAQLTDPHGVPFVLQWTVFYMTLGGVH